MAEQCSGETLCRWITNLEKPRPILASSSPIYFVIAEICTRYKDTRWTWYRRDIEDDPDLVASWTEAGHPTLETIANLEQCQNVPASANFDADLWARYMSDPDYDEMVELA